jgi:hypothetical protein
MAAPLVDRPSLIVRVRELAPRPALERGYAPARTACLLDSHRRRALISSSVQATQIRTGRVRPVLTFLPPALRPSGALTRTARRMETANSLDSSARPQRRHTGSVVGWRPDGTPRIV